MPIYKDENGVIQYTPKSDRFETDSTGVHPADSFAVCDNIDQLKQLGFDLSALAPGSRVFFKLQNPGSTGDVVITFPSHTAEVGTATRLIVERTAFEPISALRLVYSLSETEVAPASPTDDNKIVVLGLALTAAAAGEQLQVLTLGETTDPFFSFPINKTLYLGPGGVVTDQVPTSGFLVEVGSSSGTNTIFVRVDRIVQL